MMTAAEPIIVDGEEHHVGDVFEHNGEEVIFRGILESETITDPGVYYDPEEEDFVIISQEQIKNSKQILDMISEDPKEKKNPPFKKINNEIKTKSTRGRKPGSTLNDSKEEFLYYEIHPKDDKLVQDLKRVINERQVKIKDISSKKDYDYNLHYGLQKRHSIKFASVERWAKLLNLKVSISIVPINKV